jgi:hypothetical protein
LAIGFCYLDKGESMKAIASVFIFFALCWAISTIAVACVKPTKPAILDAVTVVAVQLVKANKDEKAYAKEAEACFGCAGLGCSNEKRVG